MCRGKYYVFFVSAHIFWVDTNEPFYPPLATILMLLYISRYQTVMIKFKFVPHFYQYGQINFLSNKMNYSINFFVDKSSSASKSETNPENPGLAKLRMRVRIPHGAVASFGVGLVIHAPDWDPKRQRCVRGSMHGREHNVAAWVVNARLNEMETVAHEVLASCTDSVSAREIRHRMNLALGRKSNECKTNREDPDMAESRSLCEWVDVFVGEQAIQRGWCTSTQNKYKELKGYLQSFNPTAAVSDIDSTWLQQLLQTFFDAGLHNVTINKNLEMLRWFLRWAEGHGLTSGKDWQEFNPQLKCIPRKVVFLTRDELMRITNMDLSYAPELADARDLFCLQCFTSLRFSDVSHLKSSQVKSNHIELVTRKTSKPLIIELNRHAREILDRHAGCQEPWAMPVFTVQRMNLLLKEIGRRAGLDESVQMEWYVGSKRREVVLKKWQLLTTHCGRRTFVCSSLAMGIPAEIVMRWTGHSSYKSMKPYIDVADETRRREMEKWNTWDIVR